MSRLGLAAFVLVALAGCEDDHLPPGGGGGGGGGSDGDGTVDAAAPLTDAAGAELGGTACVVPDLRFPATCPDTDLSGLIVLEWPTGAQTTAAADGSFSLAVTADADVTLESGTLDGTLVPSLVPVGPGGAADILVPVVEQTAWTELQTALGVQQPDGSAAVVLYLLDDGAPAVGAEVLAPQSSLSAPYYDDGGALEWTQSGLAGPEATALLFGVQTSLDFTDITAIGPQADRQVTVRVPVAADHITFASIDLAQ